MIDQAFQTVAEQIHGVLLPGINQAISDVLHNNVLQHMSTDQLQIACIKIALQALTLIALIWIGRNIHKMLSTNRKNRRQKKNKKPEVPQKRWTSDGWYWDDKKGKWIGPDFQNKNK